MQAIPGYASEAKWLRRARAHLRRLFPCLPRQPGYKPRLDSHRSMQASSSSVSTGLVT